MSARSESKSESGARGSVRLASSALLALAFLIAPPAAHGGGPLVVAFDGGPVTWDPGFPSTYQTDLGGLGTLSSAEATAMTDSLFGVWDAVPTSVLSLERTGQLAVNVDTTNFGYYLGAYGDNLSPMGLSPVVFDKDGSIFDLLYGIGSGVLGFAGPSYFAAGRDTIPIGDPLPPGARIIEGLSFLNGKFIDGIDDPSQGNYEISPALFRAVFVHEFGHFVGLDHTQIHGGPRPPESDEPGHTTPVETMFPYLLDADEAALGRDDVVALSALYPTADFTSSTGQITGRILTSDGQPLSGANVVAYNLDDAADAVSCVAGADLVHEGAFTLPGLTPGARYRVGSGEIDVHFRDGSRVGPFSPPVPVPAPPEFYSGASESADPEADDPDTYSPVSVTAGGTTAGIDILLNRQSFEIFDDAFQESQIAGIAFGDFDGNSLNDFVSTNTGWNPGNFTKFHRGIGGGRFAEGEVIENFPGNHFVVAGQFNRQQDSYLDVAVASSSRNDVQIYFGDGTGAFSPPVIALDAPSVFEGFSLVGMFRVDANGDAFPDLFALVTAPDGTAVAYALLGSASGVFSVTTTDLPAGSGFPTSGLAAGNLGGSPRDEVIGFTGNVMNYLELGILENDGGGHFSSRVIPLDPISQFICGASPVIGDFNEDGIADLVISNCHPAGGNPNFTRSYIDLLVGDGAGGYSLSDRYWVAGSSQSGIVAADLDGDGHLDVASTGGGGPVHPGASAIIALGDGTGHLRPAEPVWGLIEFPNALYCGELDNDRRPDLLVSAYEEMGASFVNAGCILLNRLVYPPVAAFPLLLPADGDTVRTTEPTISWEGARAQDPADTVSYVVHWSENPGFGKADSALVDTGTDYTFPPQALHVRTTYYWKVTACTQDGYCGNSTPPTGRSFYIGEAVSPCRIVPEAAARGDGILVSWRVLDVTAATGFRVYRRVAGERAGGSDLEWECISPLLSFVAGECRYLDANAEPGVRYEYVIEVLDPDGSTERFGPVGAELPRPASLALRLQPNPSPGSATVTFSLPEQGVVTLLLFDVQGREVTRRSLGRLRAGTHSIEWNARAAGIGDPPSGVYQVRLACPAGVRTTRWVLLR